MLADEGALASVVVLTASITSGFRRGQHLNPRPSLQGKLVERCNNCSDGKDSDHLKSDFLFQPHLLRPRKCSHMTDSELPTPNLYFGSQTLAPRCKYGSWKKNYEIEQHGIEIKQATCKGFNSQCNCTMALLFRFLIISGTNSRVKWDSWDSISAGLD